MCVCVRERQRESVYMSAVPTSDLKTCLAAEFVGNRHCALQLKKSCTQLDATFLYILI